MKRLLTALLAGSAVFALAFGAAATLSVDGQTLQAGDDTDLTCDQSGIHVSAWGVNTYPVQEGVEYVTITGVDDDCDGARILGRVTLNTSLAADNSSFVYTGGAAAGSSWVTASGNETTEYKLYLKDASFANLVYPDAEDIVGIKIWLEGATGDTD